MSESVKDLEKQIKEETQLAKKYRKSFTINPKSFDLLDYMHGAQRAKVEAYIDALTKVWINNTWFSYTKKYNKLTKLTELISGRMLNVEDIFSEEFTHYSIINKDSDEIGLSAYIQEATDALDFINNLKQGITELFKNPKTKNTLERWTIDSCATVRDDIKGIKLLNADPIPDDKDPNKVFLMLSVSLERVKDIESILQENEYIGIVDTAIKIVGETNGLNSLKRFIID